jgi:hypothetical protein
MRHPCRSVCVALGSVVLALIATVAFAIPTGAVDTPIPPPPPGSGQYYEGWALAPTGTDPSQPSSRAFLAYTLAPGTNASDSVTLWNYSDVQLNFKVYGTDAYNNTTGEFTLLAGDQKPKDAGSWIALRTSSLTVPARTRVDIPMEIRVPANASPGDHTAGVVASVPTQTTDSNGLPQVVDRRTGSRVYVRVTGPVNPSLTVENISTDYHGVFNPLDGSLDVSYTLRNAGNVRLGARQQVTVKDIFGREIASRKVKTIPEVLPGNAITFHESFNDVPAELRVGATVDVTPLKPVGVSDQPPAPKSWTSHAWAIPWSVLLFIALLFLVWRLYRRYRGSRTGSGAPPLPPGSVPQPPALGPGPPTGASRTPERVLQFRDGNEGIARAP